MNKLNEIVEHKRSEVESLRQSVPVEKLSRLIGTMSSARDFAGAIASHDFDGIACIAEIKKASPSRGVIAESFSPEKIAREYAQGGANAISVLTDRKFFQGSPEYIALVKRNVHVPVLRKDFIIDEYQIYESRAIGADAILLIVASLSDDQIVHFLGLAQQFGLACLVECHSKKEIDRAVDCGATIIGINNRDLKTFEVNLETSLNLKRMIPNTVLTVSESGIRNEHHVYLLRQAGFDCVLVGEQLMVQKDRAQALRQLMRSHVSA